MKKLLIVFGIIVLAAGCFGLGYMLNQNQKPAAMTVSSDSALSQPRQENQASAATGAAAESASAPERATNASEAPAAETTEITLEKAKEIALTDAGIAADAAEYMDARLDYDDGRKHYDVDFYYDGIEYDYEITADSGEIIGREQENRDSLQTRTGETEYIGVDQAKENAAGDAGFLPEDVTFTKAKLETDDGRTEYEVEFFADGREYEYVIDPYTGEILEKDMD